MLYVYLGITLYILAFVVINLLEEKEFFKQMNAALVIIPLVLRLLMIK